MKTYYTVKFDLNLKELTELKNQLTSVGKTKLVKNYSKHIAFLFTEIEDEVEFKFTFELDEPTGRLIILELEDNPKKLVDKFITEVK